MDDFKSGYYWMYSLDVEKNRIETDGRPSICYYASENNSITFIGYDMSLLYNPDDYELVERLEYVNKTGDE